jgi:DNA-binding transcriptional MerR regulator
MLDPDSDLNEPMTMEVVCEIVGAKRSLVLRLAQAGLIETIESNAGERLLTRDAVIRLRRMQRLRRDLGVNFTGAAVILDLVSRIEEMKRELARLHRGVV